MMATGKSLLLSLLEGTGCCIVLVATHFKWTCKIVITWEGGPSASLLNCVNSLFTSAYLLSEAENMLIHMVTIFT